MGFLEGVIKFFGGPVEQAPAKKQPTSAERKKSSAQNAERREKTEKAPERPKHYKEMIRDVRHALRDAKEFKEAQSAAFESEEVDIHIQERVGAFLDEKHLQKDVERFSSPLYERTQRRIEELQKQWDSSVRQLRSVHKSFVKERAMKKTEYVRVSEKLMQEIKAVEKNLLNERMRAKDIELFEKTKNELAVIGADTLSKHYGGAVKKDDPKIISLADRRSPAHDAVERAKRVTEGRQGSASKSQEKKTLAYFPATAYLTEQDFETRPDTVRGLLLSQLDRAWLHRPASTAEFSSRFFDWLQKNSPEEIEAFERGLNRSLERAATVKNQSDIQDNIQVVNEALQALQHEKLRRIQQERVAPPSSPTSSEAPSGSTVVDQALEIMRQRKSTTQSEQHLISVDEGVCLLSPSEMRARIMEAIGSSDVQAAVGGKYFLNRLVERRDESGVSQHAAMIEYLRKLLTIIEAQDVKNKREKRSSIEAAIEVFEQSAQKAS